MNDEQRLAAQRGQITNPYPNPPLSKATRLKVWATRLITEDGTLTWLGWLMLANGALTMLTGATTLIAKVSDLFR